MNLKPYLLGLLAAVQAIDITYYPYYESRNIERFEREFTNITVTPNFIFEWREVAMNYRDGTPWQYSLEGFCYFLNQDISDWEYDDRMDCSIGIVDSPLTDWQII